MKLLRAVLAYARYLMRHKYYVWQECRRLGLPWHVGAFHDWSKFLPDEWWAYVKYFHMEGGAEAFAKSGHLPPRLAGPIARAVLFHKRRNPHHFEFWVLGEEVFEMPERFWKEMIADWRGAGKAQGRPDTAAWYTANRHTITLHPETRAWVEKELGV